MSTKVLLILALVAAATCTSLKHPSTSKNDSISKKGHSELTVYLRSAFKGIREKSNCKDNIIDEVLSLDVPRTIDGAISFAATLVRGVGAIIDVYVRGLGTLLVRITIALFKTLVCFNGVCGSRNHAICQSSFDKQLNINVEVKSITKLLSAYDVVDVDAKLNVYLNQYNKRYGKTTRNSQYVILNAALELAKLLNKKEKLSKQDGVVIYAQIGLILGSLGESHSAKLGVQLGDVYFSVFIDLFKKFGIGDLSPYRSKVITQIQQCQNDGAPWGTKPHPPNKPVKPTKPSRPIKPNKPKPAPGGNTGVTKPRFTKVPDALGFLFKGIRSVLHVKGEFIEDLLNLDIPNSLNDVIRIVVLVIRGVGVVLDKTLDGLGRLIVNILVVVLKGSVCKYNKSGLEGLISGIAQILPGHKPESAICTSQFDKNFGINGDAHSYDDLCRLYKVNDADEQLHLYINKYSNGKGINGLNGYLKVIFRLALDITNLLKTVKPSQKNFTLVNVKLTLLIGYIAEGHSKGLGVQIIKTIYPSFEKHFKNNGLDFGSYQTDVVNQIQSSDCSGAPWRRNNVGDSEDGQYNNDDEIDQTNDTNEDSDEGYEDQPKDSKNQDEDENESTSVWTEENNDDDTSVNNNSEQTSDTSDADESKTDYDSDDIEDTQSSDTSSAYKNKGGKKKVIVKYTTIVYNDDGEPVKTDTHYETFVDGKEQPNTDDYTSSEEYSSGTCPAHCVPRSE